MTVLVAAICTARCFELTSRMSHHHIDSGPPPSVKWKSKPVVGLLAVIFAFKTDTVRDHCSHERNLPEGPQAQVNGASCHVHRKRAVPVVPALFTVFTVICGKPCCNVTSACCIQACEKALALGFGGDDPRASQ